MTPRVVVIASIENVQNMINSKNVGRRGEIAKTNAQNNNAGKNNGPIGELKLGGAHSGTNCWLMGFPNIVDK